ncbi:iron complex transport system ATP-binding protein [Rhodoblastus acidophilus]|uniref:ABC transporter ATP-binding protein n=1 Tax=Rhodoblastus acidophilus TaxID=1074 RepID=UPI002224A472|nr:ABC transporter ATP-binding protein [Rhodoblastus acidophilus]MCW2285813.1 iron complex transport system ATP-binding protein [Rhodoblastus acidophilus]MCW2333364.1 iron complex transport system ATP-binding protein [Rhodoblastus acidophilus]
MRARLAATALVFARNQKRRVLDGATLAFGPGEIVSLLGANGSGKTTLLRLMLGFLRPEAGTVALEGRELRAWSRRDIARKVAYVAQNHVAPFPYRVRDVVLLGRLPRAGWLTPVTSHDFASADALLDQLGILTLAERSYTEVSGGERQLVLIARALAQGASLLVMDEPMAGLDYGAQIRLMRLLQELKRKGLGVLLSTHHPEHAFWASDAIALLEQGRIAVNGAPRDVLDAEAIERLYRVKVSALAAPDGRCAFLPE